MQIELKISHAITDPRVNVLVHFAWNFPQKLVPYYCLTTTEHNSMFIAVIGISLLIYLAQYLHVWGGGGEEGISTIGNSQQKPLSNLICLIAAS